MRPSTFVRSRRRQAGFSLIEIVVVVMLIGLVLTVGAVTLTQGLGSAKIRAASRDLVAALRYTRGQAIVTRKEQVLELDVEKRAYVAPGKQAVELPGDMELALLTAAQEQVDATTGKIRFYPDGSSTGGRVRLISGDKEWHVEVAWLTGEVRMREPGREEAP
jgi:general secretion pathway protein H